VDAETGAVLSPLDRDTAVAIARADRAGSPEIREAVLIERDPPSEYREGALPAWRVDIDDDENTHIYVSTSTGRITARRNDAWRRFDFFWMLHTMDYRGRDDFNHPLLIVAAAAAVVTLASGFWLWGIRVYRRRRRRQASTAR
jgi:PepSY-associated TM region